MIEKKKIDWLAVLQGFSMLLVVIGHITLTNKSKDPTTPIASSIQAIIYSFHMPLFICISGWLFYYTCIRKSKSYKDVIKSKFKRLGIPFIAFTLITIIFKFFFPQLMNRQLNSQELIDTFILFRSNPLMEMWFIVVLFELMLLYSVYRFALKNRKGIAIISGLAVLCYFYFPSCRYFFLHKTSEMLFFFIMGMVSCKYSLQRYLKGILPLIFTGVLFVVFNVLHLVYDAEGFISIISGILFSFSLCINIAEILPKLFSSFRDYTFQIFLMGIFFQMPIRWIYTHLGNEMLFIPLWLVSMIIGVYAPTFIAKKIQAKAPKSIRLCFGL